MTKKKPILVPNYCGFTELEMHTLYKVKSSPWFWRQKAEQLKYAADILWPLALRRVDKINRSINKKGNVDFSKLPPEMFSTAKGLLGYALECLFKACIIRDNPNFMGGGQQDERLKTHNLLKLAEIAKISLSQDERYTCGTFTETMYLDFRYPVDRQATLRKSTIMVGRSIIEVGNELYERLHATVNQIHTGEDGVINFDSSTVEYSSNKAKKTIAKSSKSSLAKLPKR